MRRRDDGPTVLHLIGSLEIGGTERQLVEFIGRSSEPERHVVALFSSYGPLAERLPSPPIWLGRLGRRPRDIGRDARTLLALRRTVRAVGADVVHAHLHASELLAAAGTPRGIPIVASRRGHAGRYEGSRTFAALERVAHRRIGAMICNSEYLARRARSRDPALPPIEVIHNAVDLDRFAPRPLPDGPPRATVVANLHPYKGHDRLLRAWHRVRRTLPAATLTFVGEGSERGRLEQLTEDLRLDDAVTFAGPVADPRPHIERAHVVALASDYEGFPNALLEAMAMARPVVATRAGGIPELVRDEQDGFLTSSEPSDIAERLLLLLGDADLRARLGASARSRAETFTWDRVVEKTEAVYRRVLGR
jgi:L-malate glycosyltransferase